ncbi:hypothetical protein V8C37DRAFT_36240 [Trichoderma ceciliae]
MTMGIINASHGPASFCLIKQAHDDGNKRGQITAHGCGSLQITGWFLMEISGFTVVHKGGGQRRRSGRISLVFIAVYLLDILMPCFHHILPPSFSHTPTSFVFSLFCTVFKIVATLRAARKWNG